MKDQTKKATADVRLLTKVEVAEKLSISKSYVEFLVRARKLDCVRMGPNTLRFRETDVESFIEAHACSRAATLRRASADAAR